MRSSRAAFRLVRGFARGIPLDARLARGIPLGAQLARGIPLGARLARHSARCAALRAVSIQNVSADEKYIGSGSQSW